MQTSGVLLMLGLTVAVAARLPAADSLPLQEIGPCRMQDTPWADGDSFRVTLPDGKEETFRLYGVDCLECNVAGDDSNARRLRDQRRWFGILDIAVAKGLGIAAKKKTAELLSRPFHIHTAFADGRGDPEYRRYYAFVTLEDGTDLSETLVQLGLARAFGVSRQRPDGTSAEEWKQRLTDLELLASRKGAGAWAFTDWDRLPEERKQLRAEEAELAVAKGSAKLTEGMTIDLNAASRDELLMLEGIGDVRANAIIENRPFGRVDDLEQVHGIGEKTLEALRPFLRVGDLKKEPAGP